MIQLLLEIQLYLEMKEYSYFLPLMGRKLWGRVDIWPLTRPATINHHWHGHRVFTWASWTFLLKFPFQNSQRRLLHMLFSLPTYNPAFQLFFQTQLNTSGNPWPPWWDHLYPNTWSYRTIYFIFTALFTFHICNLIFNCMILQLMFVFPTIQ